MSVEMMQSPMSPVLSPVSEFVQHYIDSLENLPMEIQRLVTRLREYDILYRNIMDQVGRYLGFYRTAESGPGKMRFLTKIQKCLVKSQQYGDVKLDIISQIVETIESHSQQLARDAERLDLENTDDNFRSGNEIINYRMKMEKGVKINEKLPKNMCEKPKRQPRRSRGTEKVPEKNDKSYPSSLQRYADKEELEEEEIKDEEIEEDEIETTEVKVKRDLKRKPEKVKEKEKVKEEKEERKEERKTTGKVARKSATPKQPSSKMKKKRKKEKESAVEDIPVDPDEPTYCICNSISYGDMICCDNDDCEFEWFHFGCVNLTHKPKGKWYCPRCTTERKEKGKK